MSGKQLQQGLLSPRGLLVYSVLLPLAVLEPLVSPESRSHSTKATGNKLLKSKICCKSVPAGRKGGERGRTGLAPSTHLPHSCCAHYPSLLPPHPHPYSQAPSHFCLTGRFLVTVPPSVVKIASSWKEFQNETYAPLQPPK